jgi:GTPase SAR1 family protein
MLYWKKNEGSRYGGFYEEEIPGSTPVTQQELDELIKKQEMGFEIIDDGNGKPISTVPLDSINKESIKRRKIVEIKAKLNSTDYQIIKCYEASMRQLPLPYNLEELATQRDAWRAEINQLEEELKQYEV